MTVSAARDQGILAKFLRQTHVARDLPAFVAAVTKELPAVVPAKSCWYREFTRWPPRVRLVVHPAEVKRNGNERVFQRYLNEHPVIAYRERTFDHQAVTLSDFLSTARRHGLNLYNEFYRPMGVEHQISIALSLGPFVSVALALGRDRVDFSARDRHCLNRLLPHLVESHRSACALSVRGVRPPSASEPDAAHPDFVVLSGTQAGFVAPHIHTWLVEYLGRGVRSGVLPDSLASWIRYHKLTLAGSDGLPPPRHPFVIERTGKRLVLRLFSDGDRDSLFFQEEIIDQPARLRAFGLTVREAQILRWLTQGKSNNEIGAALDIRPRTVAKHLERIFLKLGVRSRTSAVAHTLSLIVSGGSPPLSR